MKKTEKTILCSVIIGIFFVALGSYLVTTNVFGEGLDLETGNGPRGLGINSFTNKIYVANYLSNSVSVINGDTNSIDATITLEDGGGFYLTSGAAGVAVNPYSNLIYVTQRFLDSVSVIDGTTNTIIDIIPSNMYYGTGTLSPKNIEFVIIY